MRLPLLMTVCCHSPYSAAPWWRASWAWTTTRWLICTRPCYSEQRALRPNIPPELRLRVATILD
eukprot:42877-Eustigmatos_ZCMA.PRE.1